MAAADAEEAARAAAFALASAEALEAADSLALAAESALALAEACALSDLGCSRCGGLSFQPCSSLRIGPGDRLGLLLGSSTGPGENTAGGLGCPGTAGG